jgi:hypothetical protein
MKKWMIGLFVLSLSYGAFGDGLSDLMAEFQKRDEIKLTADQGAVLNFLSAVKYAPQGIQEIEIVAGNIFIFRDRNGDYCKGDMSQVLVQCFNEIGVPSFSFQNDPKLKFNPADPVNSAMTNEFLRREQIKFTIDQKLALSFLKKMDYRTQGIIQLEMMDPTHFLHRDRNGNVCLGDIGKQILRCKNEIGITGVSFQGDAD